MALTLVEIRKKIVEAKNEDVATANLKEKVRRLKRLKELLARLKQGEDITRSTLLDKPGYFSASELG